MKILSVCSWALACTVSLGTANAELNLMPQPTHVVPSQGKLKIDQSFRIAFTVTASRDSTAPPRVWPNIWN